MPVIIASAYSLPCLQGMSTSVNGSQGETIKHSIEKERNQKSPENC